MKSSKLLLVSLASFGFALGFGVLNVNAQNAVDNNPAPVPVKTDAIPRIYGSLTSGKVDGLKYTPAVCPAFVFDIDAVALQNSTSRAYAEAEVAKVPALKARWQKFEDCLVSNTKQDSSLILNKLQNSFKGPDTIELDAYSKIIDSTKINRERIIEELKKKSKIKSKKPDTLVEPNFVTTWKAPEGRMIGTITEGTIDKVQYSSGCPLYLGEVTIKDLDEVKTAARYEQLAANINQTDDRRRAHLKCRNENTTLDYNEISKAIQTGFDGVYKPAGTEYLRKISILEKVIEVARKSGGTLAPTGKPTISKPVAKPVAKPVTKKKN